MTLENRIVFVVFAVLEFVGCYLSSTISQACRCERAKATQDNFCCRELVAIEA